MFRGANAINLDAKGRMMIPAKARSRLAEVCTGELVITRHLTDPCLLLYPLSTWEEVEARIDALPGTSAVNRTIKRRLIGHAAEVDMDASGRVLLPPLLREIADLEKQIILVGQGKSFEIWDEARWQSRIDQDMADEQEFEDSVAELDLVF